VTHNLQAEKALLGGLLKDNLQIHEIALTLRPEDFGGFAHQRLFEAITDLAVIQGKPADPVTVADWLKERNLVQDVGYAHIVEIWQAASPANCGAYAQIVAQKALARTLVNAANEILKGVEESDPQEVLLQAQRTLFDAGSSKDRVSVFTVAEATTEALAAVDRRSVREEGFPTGIASLDELVRLREGELTIIGARPGVGKTALALNVFYHMATVHKAPSLFVSLEQGNVEIGKRLLCLHASVDGYRVRMGWLHQEERARLKQAQIELSTVLGWIKDTPGVTMLQILAEGRRRVVRDGIKAIFVDYLQLVAPEDRKEQRYVQVGQISRRLKWMSRELRLPVVAMCQVGRASDKEEPRLSHLRESGDIEADADNVILLHDPQMSDDKREPETTVKAIVAKQRDGPCGSVPLTFQRQYLRFKGVEDLK
jgi:replicative DNA helicase